MYDKIQKRYVFILKVKSLGNFIHANKIWHNGFHAYSVGLLYPHLFAQVFLAPSL